ncbi:hypothetical protein E2P81_ATG00398 [Venturia nashicola]|uniref:Uncharacterized protein n=1 Tax=Venturia nashicola TaxID=86259 RepID=A0A4Z1PW41_9PEZI|nr:hypothetical protein E6O75_ATG00407 [Venturia nashicola]TLD39411.1 hypothetical protein E2P81_ATG00398 [Venturia nashicola]
MVSLAALSLALPNAEPLANPFALGGRAVGGKCDHNGIKGTCEKSCQGGFQTVGDCPNDPTKVKCCMFRSCTVKSTGVVGGCRNVGSGGNCVGGHFVAGLCPGPDDVQCCVPNKSPPP